VIIGGYTAEMGGSATGVRSLVDSAEDGAIHLDEAAGRALTSPSSLIAHPERPWLFAPPRARRHWCTALRCLRTHFEFASPSPACIVLGTR